jgi:hypothetical protein
MLRAPLAGYTLAMEARARFTLELERVQHYRFLESEVCLLTNLRAPPSAAHQVQFALMRVAQGV